MKNIFLSRLIIGAFAFLLLACETGQQNNEKPAEKTSAEIKKETLSREFTSIHTQVDTSWHNMIEDDNQKLADMSRLLDEVSYTGEYDQDLYRSLKEQVQKLREQRYTQTTMSNSNEIDLYDEASRRLMLEVITFAQQNPQYERYPLMEELIYDIRQRNEQVLFYRMDYDDAAKAYNRFLEQHPDFVQSLDTARTEPLPLFQLKN